MLASCDLSSFVLMFMTKVCKGESRKNENRDWVGGRGGVDFGKRAFPSFVFYSHHFPLRAKSRSNGNKTSLF